MKNLMNSLAVVTALTLTPAQASINSHDYSQKSPAAKDDVSNQVEKCIVMALSIIETSGIDTNRFKPNSKNVIMLDVKTYISSLLHRLDELCFKKVTTKKHDKDRGIELRGKTEFTKCAPNVGVTSDGSNITYFCDREFKLPLINTSGKKIMFIIK